MKLYIIILLNLFVFACNNSATTKVENHTDSSRTNKNDTNSASTKNEINEYEDYYIVIADTGTNYYTLKDKMCKLALNTKIPIDSMGRYYNKAKNLIALPDNDSDEIYRGQYYPRRFPSSYLSLEYLDYYKEIDADKTIAIVAGICETKHEADSVLNLINKFEKKAYGIKSKIYTGCMH